MNTTVDVLLIQRALRRRLFEGSAPVSWRPGREVAAHLLLYIDDPVACWRIAVEWLRDVLGADRVDGGYGGYMHGDGGAQDYVVQAEALCASVPMKSVVGQRFDAAQSALRSVWLHVPTPIGNVAQERRLDGNLRDKLQNLGTASKLALPVRDGLQPVGLICADWHRVDPFLKPSVCTELSLLMQTAIGPLLAAAAQVAAERRPRVSVGSTEEAGVGTTLLTMAEMRVAKLAASGMSYKEMARALGRSHSTVDHQLRSIRRKMGTPSTSRLVPLLNDYFKSLR